MSTSAGDRARSRRSRYQIIDLRTSSIADGSLHDPSQGQDQSPDEIIGRDTLSNQTPTSSFGHLRNNIGLAQTASG